MAPGWLNLDNQTDDTLFGGEKPAFDLGLTRMQRIMCFGGCFVFGLGISLLGAILLIIDGIGAFAALFAIGALVSLAGTGFLIGFKRQGKLMFKPVRIAATIIMLVAIVLSFVAAFALPSNLAILCLIFVIIQYLAQIWYTLSYIPYARGAIKNLVGF